VKETTARTSEIEFFKVDVEERDDVGVEAEIKSVSPLPPLPTLTKPVVSLDAIVHAIQGWVKNRQFCWRCSPQA
jgi:hypothetical protein